MGIGVVQPIIRCNPVTLTGSRNRLYLRDIGNEGEYVILK